MKVIHKKISLEPYKSRINGCLESYGISQPYMGNYGMFPYDVKYNGIVLSYPTLMERYYFCKRYKELLKYDNCDEGGIYDNAVTFYTHNFKYKTDELKKEYGDLDSIFEKYGGDNFLNWCEDILYNGTEDYSNSDVENITNSAHILIPILFTNTIDDMGEFSIFCEEWEDGVEYKQGNLVIYDDRIWEKNNTDYGSIYSEKYKERYFPQIGDGTFEHIYDKQWYEKSSGKIIYSENQWNDFTDKNFSKNDTEYKNITANTYSVRNGAVYYNADPKEDMAYKYKINTNDKGYYIIDDIIFKPISNEYIIYDRYVNPYFFTYEVDNFVQLNTKYCYIKGQKIFSRTDDGVSHYFYIDGVKYYVQDKSDFIEYKGNAYKIENDKVTIEGVTYPKIDAYVIIDGVKYYVQDGKVITFKRNDNGTEYTINESLVTSLGENISTADNTSSGYTISDDIIYVFKPYNEYSVSSMSGYTESKLTSLKTYGSAYDDMGNELLGSLKIEDEKYVQPKDNDCLELPYKVGNTSELTPFEDENGNVEAYFGNILTSITLYYVDFYGNKIKETEIICNANDSVLTKIEDCNNKKQEFLSSHTEDNYIAENHHTIQEEIRCNFKYHMGAMINSGKTSVIENNSGVTYEEEVKLVKKSFEYMLDEISSFIVYYYDIEYNDTFDVLNEYSNNSIKVGKSYFSYKIDDLVTNTQTNKYRAKHDGMIGALVFRKEYMFGSSSLENIQSDIYIDRGFSSSFERHLKLLDVNSMESLENYGNGFYNIIES